VKNQHGHAEAAGEIAGLISKTVLAIETAVIPPSLNKANADPEIDLKGLGLQVNTT